MNLSSSTPRRFSFDALTDYDNGIDVLNANTINYKTNKAWKVSVKAWTSDFTVGTLATPMPASVIKVRKKGNNSLCSSFFFRSGTNNRSKWLLYRLQSDSALQLWGWYLCSNFPVHINRSIKENVRISLVDDWSLRNQPDFFSSDHYWSHRMTIESDEIISRSSIFAQPTTC